jgi:hypothetical protein
MDIQSNNAVRWFFALPILVILAGVLTAAWIFEDGGLGEYPDMIAEAYSQEQVHLAVPGVTEAKLSRQGAYGIYYVYDPSARGANLEMPPAIQCTLTSNSSGAEQTAAPDYVETNRYWTKDHDGTGVLIQSLTVEQADTYTFACRYLDDRAGPEIEVALGPNYTWEFLKVVGKIGLPLLGGISVLCGTFLLAGISLLVAVILWARSLTPSQKSG